MVDNQEVDEKIIAIPFRDPVYSGYRDISTLPQHILTEISHFFEVYKALEIIAGSLRRYEEVFPEKRKGSQKLKRA